MKALLAGALGAVAANLAHEGVRRATPQAPRVDLLGMQALAKMIGTRTTPPRGRALYLTTLAGDLLSNAVYFSLIGVTPRGYRVASGLAVGTVAGIGAVYLPPLIGLASSPTARTATTKALTVLLYAAGGLTTGLALRNSR